MTIEAVDLFMRRTGQQTDFNGVKLRKMVISVIFGHHLIDGHKSQYKEEESPKKAIFLFHDAKLLYIFQ